MNHTRMVSLFSVAMLCCGLSATAADKVHIVHGLDAPQIEKYAADELKGQFERLFSDIHVVVGTAASPDANTTIFVGSPATNAQLATLFTNWPDVSDQGIVIQSLPDKSLYAVGGGSPAATLWAAYELGYRLGIRYLPCNSLALRFRGIGRGKLPAAGTNSQGIPRRTGRH
ncbi:MAG: hypothetical protein GY826_39975 [Fuerstiella sp.]|nr:hypothetical protein [Fuerstiella sp.]